MKPDRRKNIRVPGPFQAHRAGAPDIELHVLDLSEGGCFVGSRTETPTVGSSFGLTVTLPEAGNITLTGEVVYIRPGLGFGMLFTNLSPEIYRRLEQGVDTLRRKKRS
jgi:hypothetical protein